MIPGYIYYFNTYTNLVERAYNRYHLVAWWSWVHHKWFDYRADPYTVSAQIRIPDTAALIMKVKI